MARLEYTFKNDVLFKVLFVSYQDLLKRLVAALLDIEYASIDKLEVTNPDIPPKALKDKFCHLDINMRIDDKLVDLEIQVNNEGDYLERSMYYWARLYSSALGRGKRYCVLPQTIVISIIDFELFDCKDFHSKFTLHDVSRREELSGKMALHYFELPKFPIETLSADNELSLWMALFRAETEEDLKKIDALEVPFMKKAIRAYHKIKATGRFKELSRLRELARHNEASALAQRDAKWQGIIEQKDAQIAEQAALIAKLQTQQTDKETVF